MPDRAKKMTITAAPFNIAWIFFFVLLIRSPSPSGTRVGPVDRTSAHERAKARESSGD